MGNTSSGSSGDNEDEESDLLDSFEDEGEDGEKDEELDVSMDLSALFDHKLLRESASKIKEDPKETLLQQHHGVIVRWLEERRSRSEEIVSLAQFRDMLVSRGTDRDEAEELFNQFDAEGEGAVEVNNFIEMLTSSPGGGALSRAELPNVVKTLQACSLTPGFIDAFAENRDAVTNHGKKILRFLLRNRSPSRSLPLPALEGFCNTSEMRLKVLQAHLQALKSKVENKKKAPALETGEVLKPLYKCFNIVETSTNRVDSSRLTNRDPSTYWQSDGPARSHWIRLRMLANVVIRQLTITVSAADQSYMPQQVVVFGGRDERHLTELNDVRIPSHVTGDVVLLANVKVPYSVIQISIKRCQSDGCDTRIRGVTAIGYRVVRSKGVSVSDAAAVWYLSVLASTATAAIPVQPELRQILLKHTRDALGHMKPLSLSINSPDRPSFLTSNVMETVQTFIHTLVNYENSLSPDGLQVLVEFALARGNLGNIFSVLKLLYDHIHLDFKAGPLFKSLFEVKERLLKSHSLKLSLSIAFCDGGSAEDMTEVQNILSDNWTSEAYTTPTGKKNVNIVFTAESGNVLQVTRLSLKVSKGGIGPGAGLIFVLNELPSDGKDFKLTGFDKYIEWNKSTYDDYLSTASHSKDPCVGPVAYFTVEEWDEVDVALDRIATGKYILLMFLRPRDESATKLSILGFRCYGYEKSLEEVAEEQKLETVAPLSTVSGIVEGTSLFIRILAFTDDMAKDLKLLKIHRKSLSLKEKEEKLEISNTTVQQLWDVYKLVTSRGFKYEKVILSCKLILRLFLQALPFLKHTIHEHSPTEEQLQVSHDVFSHLCSIVDDDGTTHDPCVQQIAKDIILEGAEVFFPDGETRRRHLLSMVDQVMEEHKATSLGLTFESLCRFFSHKDASGLLGLPADNNEEDFEHGSVLSVMTTLVSVAFRECQTLVNSECSKTGTSPSNLLQLLCAMQKSLLSWCHTQLRSSSEKSPNRDAAKHFLVEYATLLSSKICESLKLLLDKPQDMSVMDKLEYSYISVAGRQIVLLLNAFTDIEAICLPLLQSLQLIAIELKKLSSKMPELFLKIDGQEWRKTQDEVVLRTWDVESPHNYENNQNIQTVFSVPGCTSFVVEFDPRCETERRYDYLEFTDSNGIKRRFDQKADTEKWPLTCHFKAGNRLHFLFHSDGSNNEWGYKFKVTATGSPDVALSWVFDLQLGLARLFGLFCSHALDTSKSFEDIKKDSEEARFAQSELWATMLRGGYEAGFKSKLQRSLSGQHATVNTEHGSDDSIVKSFLLDVAESEEQHAQDFIKRCRENVSGLGPQMGGPLVDQAINAVFAALVWHSQDIREAMKLSASGSSELVPDKVLQAYKAAESLRRTLVDRKQQMIVQTEEDSNQSDNHNTEPDYPTIQCKEKAGFLMKFAGLTLVSSKIAEAKDKTSWSSKRHAWHKATSQGSTTSITDLQEEPKDVRQILDKHPSFRLILDFVSNEAMSHEKIEGLITSRKRHAKVVADIYMFASEFLRISAEPHIFLAAPVLFLQQMLVAQDKFPRHYADSLDGCGLELEGHVRRAYYTFIRRLLDAVKQKTLSDERQSNPALECVRAYLLHFLDMEWKGYDHAFVSEIRLPEFLLDTAKATVTADKHNIVEMSEQMEIERYDQFMKWYEEVKSESGFYQWWGQHTEDQDNRTAHLFVASFSDMLDVEIVCDGCQTALPGRRYRCLSCKDMDLCSKCYSENVKPKGHSEEHEMIDLRFKCDQCKAFIVGTRFHCNECDDFDLCLGCKHYGKWPDKHSAAHSMVKFPLKSGDGAICRPSCLLQVYCHHHCWLQYSALTLNLAESLNNPDKSGLEMEYLRTAGNLCLESLELTTKCFASCVSILTAGFEEKQVKEKKLKEQKTSNAANIVASQLSLTTENATQCETDSAVQQLSISTETSNQVNSVPEVAIDTNTAEIIDSGLPSANNNGNSTTPVSTSDISTAASNTADSNIPVLASADTSCDTNVADSAVPGLSIETNTVDQKASAENKNDSEPSIDELEKLFAKEALEKLLGLLGSVIPKDSKLEHWARCCSNLESFIAEKFLPVLFNKIRNEKNDCSTRRVTLAIIGKFLQCISPKLSDKAVAVTCGDENEDYLQEQAVAGNKTIQFLFNLGAECLARSDLESSSGVSTVLLQLSCSAAWKSGVDDFVVQCLDKLKNTSQKPDLSAVFGLLVFAGFPNVLCMGSLVHLKEPGETKRDVIVLKYMPEKGSASVVDIKTRRPKTVREHHLDSEGAKTESVNMTRCSVLIDISREIMTDMKKDPDRVSIERMWVLYLSFKALLANLQNSSDSKLCSEIISSGLVSLLVYLACKGTSFSQLWLLRDLEVLSLRVYNVHEHSQHSLNMDKVASQASVSTQASSSDTSTEADPLQGLDDPTQKFLKTIHEAVLAPLSILRALYEFHQQSRERMLEEVQTCFNQNGFKARTEIAELAKKWEAPVAIVEPVVVVDTVAADVGVVRFIPKDLETNSSSVAKAEDLAVSQKLIPNLTEAEIDEAREQQSRAKSVALLRKELEKETKSGSSSYVKKVNFALSVLYSRHLLAALLADWPEGQPITADLMNNCDEVDLVSLLDIFQKAEKKTVFEKVVINVVKNGHPSLTKPLSLAAANCMGEVKLSSEVKESAHNYKNNTKEEGKVYIPGAVTLTIKFDPRCCTEDSCDELVISSTADFIQNRHVISGPPSHWIDFELPGDTLYYKFTSDSSNSDWGWKFIVTGGQLGRFETGFAVLQVLLSLNSSVSRSLPLKQLWSWLVSVACCQTGQQRLMATGLLLRLLLAVSGQLICEDGQTSEPVDAADRPDLSLLKPLWALYTKLLEKEGITGTAPSMIPPVLRGLTELFLVVENLAQEWGVAEELVVGLTTEESLHRCFAQAVRNVGAIGIAINMPNKASLALIKAAEKASLVEQNKEESEAKKTEKSHAANSTEGDSNVIIVDLDTDNESGDELMSSDDDDDEDDDDEDDDNFADDVDENLP